ncbi:antibiotic biosynthesis monooxygenase [Leptospira barantonii]|uniref:Antibiotic biosynthesis monooxygenase n=1 Tax=Leptospira barantonii TaxID=2023184 RepID=A0A5F2B5S2_9LEPT|nr:antibiotic biosynthesis monooxygenase [Leptospira barantonii]TGM00973.1 antibiotic biosynthesis monooxygenase [Leptospira barantonii]
MHTILIDQFTVPQKARKEFLERLNINRNFIHTLSGFVKDSVYEAATEEGKFKVVTVAVWETEEKFQNAKSAVALEYKKQGFDINAMIQRLEMTIERGIYNEMQIP